MSCESIIFPKAFIWHSLWHLGVSDICKLDQSDFTKVFHPLRPFVYWFIPEEESLSVTYWCLAFKHVWLIKLCLAVSHFFFFFFLQGTILHLLHLPLTPAGSHPLPASHLLRPLMRPPLAFRWDLPVITIYSIPKMANDPQ